MADIPIKNYSETKQDVTKKKNKSIERENNVSTNERDWSDGLPPDLVRFMSKKLPDISKFIQFRSVCKTWRFSAPIYESPPQLPWIFDGGLTQNHIRFYSLSSGETFIVPAPTSEKKCFEGSFYGYMFGYDYDYKMVSLFNPISHDHVSLPRPNIAWLYPIYVSSDPIRSGTYAVVMSLSYRTGKKSTTFAFCGLDDKRWTYMQCVLGYVHSCLVYNGKLFLEETQDDNDTLFTKVIAITTQSVVYEIPEPESGKSCGHVKLVESAGEILRVARSESFNFRIYKLDFGKGNEQPRWIEIDSIGDQVLFVYRLHIFSLSANNFPAFKGNCIYYLRDESFYDEFLCHRVSVFRPYKYNIEDHTSELIDCPFDIAGGWYIPMVGSKLWPYMQMSNNSENIGSQTKF